MSEPAERIWVYYGTEGEPMRALHPLIEVVQGDGRSLYESGGFSGKPGSCVEAALRCGGFIGGGDIQLSVRRIEEEGLVFCRQVGFAVAAEHFGEVDGAIRDGLRGDIGGWTSVLMSQTGFHLSPYAFAHAWATAGRPALTMLQPELSRQRYQGGGSGPPTLPDLVALDLPVRAALKRFGAPL